ncbi:hypothetical protein CDL15_Pgr027360 [Punica granatum]|uniref:Uncharacterized protein n=1 Tax=Punica granatum TaxID=22663 RepID=A0A218Y0R5_PUNGR|nr:hypothetical protein CDL15_Pgr027360 [Punica granatum]
MTRSVPTSLAGVTHYGDLGANFNQGGPSEVVSVQALNANALVFYRRCDSWWAVCATVAPGRLMSSMSTEIVALMA